MHVCVQYQAIREKIYAAHYLLTSPEEQMRAYVYDVIRASLPNMDLDQAFESKDDISMSLKTHLEEVMSSYGFTILQVLLVLSCITTIIISLKTL